jgi:acetolactate synthase I/II/III large subunit
MTDETTTPEDKAVDAKANWRPEMEGTEVTGAEMFVESIIREGVDLIFGYPGGVVLKVFDEMYKRRSEIRIIVPRHEQAGGHAVDAISRATGKTATLFVTSGPGATNTVTALATAMMDSVPMVCFTGQVSSGLIGSDAFQETDSIGVTRPVVKHSFMITSAEDIPRIIREAYYIAGSGRPGPVLVDIPKDFTTNTGIFHWPESVSIRGYKPTYEGHPKSIQRLADAIAEADRPYLYVGGGVVLANAHEELMELVKKTNIPVTTTLMALGAFPGTHPLFVGMPGMHGSKLANIAFQECDLIISVGARFDDRVTGNLKGFAPKAKIAHVDVDPSSIKKNVKVDYPVVGDAKWVLTELNKIIKPREPNEWNRMIEGMKETHWYKYRQDTDVIHPQYVVDMIYQMTKDLDPIVSTEVGQMQMWAAQYFLFDKPRRWLTSGGLGTMGYGLPAAIGAQVAFPDRLVIDFGGDSSTQMNIQELATIQQHNLPVKIANLNNGYMGMVRQWQELFYERHYSASCLGLKPDFAKVAEAYDVKGITVREHAEVIPAIELMISHPGPVLVDFLTNPEENVYPMVPAGAALHEMTDEEWA